MSAMAQATKGFDPVLVHEYRLALTPIGRPKWMTFLSRHGPSFHDAGMLISLLIAIFGVRQRRAVREAAAVAAAASQEAVKHAVGTAVELVKRIGSRDGLSSMVTGSSGTSPASGGILNADAETERAPGTSDVAHFTLPPPTGFMPRLAKNLKGGNFDNVLLGFLGSKLALLVLFTMPLSYYFGLKRKFLHWAARSPFFRLYIRAIPYFSLSLVALASIVARDPSLSLKAETVKRWQSLSLLNTALTYCTVRLFELVRGDPAPVIQVEETAEDRDLLAVQPLPLGFFRNFTAPLRQLLPPHWSGLDNLPQNGKNMIFVGNHCIWGIDCQLLLYGLLEKKGIFGRPLGEHSWFALPGVSGMVKYSGGVDGTRHNCDLLMSNGHNMLVYPGGARESWKRSTDEKYAVLWGDHHLGFVAMAVRHGYTIVPIASVGTEDVFKVAKDMPLNSILTLGGLLPSPKRGTSKAFEKESKLPLLSVHPLEAQRSYFRVMPGIPTADYKGQEEDDDLLRRLRDETKRRLVQAIDECKEFRETDPDRYVFARDRSGNAKQDGAKVPDVSARL